jgi:tRNA-specific 2-thiouridylase
VKARHRQADQDCTVSLRPDGGLRVTTELAQRAVTPGQSAVFYDGDVCLGGAVIATTTTAETDATAARKL